MGWPPGVLVRNPQYSWVGCMDICSA